MPTLQGSLPPELANNVVRLYRECLRRATFIGKQVRLLSTICFSVAFNMSDSDTVAFAGIVFGMIVIHISTMPDKFENNNPLIIFLFVSVRKIWLFRTRLKVWYVNKPLFFFLFFVLQQHNTELVVGMVRQQFKKHMNETDPEKIHKLKDDAARGLINHMLFESEKLTGRKVSQRS
ncbi:hypothetical protein F2Q69_00003635 [Brassica cretica]|uniref:Uncharacterized protein n=1 Tax=Brassica cretica TaxID=69181 RepID=A0A8S9PIT1_BRACR|nr:hypothetical protein F2Q69_00003635 [Brassica cretica]